ncbi:MAG: peptidoglycan DD-metalloendopeptidase family protein [Gammaproteobacteria bacterium]|nr:peptidoglycan DD-metalloendopeptidase family protein [Gammaproteobacteria bacterium]
MPRVLPLLPFLLALHGCGAVFEAWSEGPPAQRAVGKGVHTVHKGDTLYAIAWLHGLDYRRLAEWNDIAAPRYLIRPGQSLRLAPPADHRRAAAKKANKAKAKKADTDNKANRGAAPRAQAAPAAWKWPLGSPRAKPRATKVGSGRGLLIRGRPGQTVHSAAAGRVVYSGFGLKHYRGLVIIHHAGDFFSAYGGNGRLLVAEGDAVGAAQPIAQLAEGRAGGGAAALYFEIRRRNRTVNPLRYLPAL